MRTKVTLVLLFLNVALFFFIFKFERHWRTERASLEARRRVLGAEAADIRSLEIASSAPGGSFSLARRGDTWWVTKPLEWPANPPAVDRIKNELLFLEHVTSFNVRDLAKNDQSLASYGLDKPKLTIAFTSGEPSTSSKSTPVTLAIGDATKVGNNLYVLSPDGQRIHVVGRALLDSLTQPFEKVRADTLLTIPVYEARSLILQSAAPALRTYVRKEGSRWLFETPILARASKNAVDLTINELNALRVKSFVTQNFPATLPSSAPTLRVTLEGNNRRETLLIGTPVSAALLPPGATPPAETEYYAQFEDRSSPRAALFTVVIPTGPKSLMAKLGNAQEDLREKHILEFDASAVSAITLRAPGQELVLQRLDPRTSPAPGATVARDGIWQIIRRGDAAQGPQTLPADRAAVQRLLEQLSLFEATKFLTESAATTDLENWGFNRPEREITLTLDGPPTTIASVQIGRTAPRDKIAYARLGPANNPGASIYEVNPDILQETRLELRVWRERLLRELPPAARIAALKLTDLGNSQALLDITFDQAGNATPAVSDAASVQEVLKQLRTLRAKSFTQDAFTDRVMFAGEERAWRYELAATISLPGGVAGEQTATSTLLLTERGGGTQQLAGSKEHNAVFELEQPFVDALWALIYGPRDPGPPPAPPAPPAAGAAGEKK